MAAETKGIDITDQDGQTVIASTAMQIAAKMEKAACRVDADVLPQRQERSHRELAESGAFDSFDDDDLLEGS